MFFIFSLVSPRWSWAKTSAMIDSPNFCNWKDVVHPIRRLFFSTSLLMTFAIRIGLEVVEYFVLSSVWQSLVPFFIFLSLPVVLISDVLESASVKVSPPYRSLHEGCFRKETSSTCFAGESSIVLSTLSFSCVPSMTFSVSSRCPQYLARL